MCNLVKQPDGNALERKIIVEGDTGRDVTREGINVAVQSRSLACLDVTVDFSSAMVPRVHSRCFA